MPTIKGLPKGKAEPLHISEGAGRRFFVGLSWDPVLPQKAKLMPSFPSGDPAAAGEGVLMLLPRLLMLPFRYLLRPVTEADARAKTQWSKSEDAKGRDKDSPHYDLDLACHVFDADFNPLVYVGPEDAAFIDASKKIYHSGEDQAGFGGPDDETVSVETVGLPENYHHFFFVVECDSKYSFGEIRNPAIRLADGKAHDGDNMIEATIVPPVHYNARGLVFCHVWREGDGFMLRNLEEYTGDNMDWPKFLRGFVPGLPPLPEDIAAENAAEAPAQAGGAA
jgi:stress response protein SCP2